MTFGSHLLTPAHSRPCIMYSLLPLYFGPMLGLMVGNDHGYHLTLYLWKFKLMLEVKP
jgi:hypothetical protein